MDRTKKLLLGGAIAIGVTYAGTEGLEYVMKKRVDNAYENLLRSMQTTSERETDPCQYNPKLDICN